MMRRDCLDSVAGNRKSPLFQEFRGGFVLIANRAATHLFFHQII
jgi:hypothetical protein